LGFSIEGILLTSFLESVKVEVKITFE